jgi:lipopolysaccharide transport system permease protein/teichoic acid transport system permease protein
LVVYFVLCNITLLLGLGWLCAALQVFYRDVGQALGVFLNLWFWATPIVWPQNIMPEKYQAVFTYNPMFYIIDGYRGQLLYETARWPGGKETIIFWTINLAILYMGTTIFRRLKPEFADVI